MYKHLAKTLFVGKTVIYLPSCHSTNEKAAEFLENQNLAEGAVIVTDRQTAGKGQRGNSWQSAPHQNLTFSILLQPKTILVPKQFYLNMAISLGVYDYLSSRVGGTSVKWPNDIYIKNKKAGGILIRNFLKRAQIVNSIVGIGLNINQSVFKYPQATSLKVETGKGYQLEEELEDLAKSIELRYLQLRNKQFNQLKNDYLSNLFRFGEEHLFDDGQIFHGRIVGVSNEGKLEIDTDKGKKPYGLKEVKFII